MRLELIFTEKANPQLKETHCFLGGSKAKTIKHAIRGLDSGANSIDYGSFGWTRGVQALSIFLLRWAAWGRLSVKENTQKPLFSGRRPSVAATLNDVLTKKPTWLSDIFGMDYDGNPNIQFITRTNPDFKTMPDSPVEIALDYESFPPTGIIVKIHNVSIEDPQTLMTLADAIEQRCSPKNKIAANQSLREHEARIHLQVQADNPQSTNNQITQMELMSDSSPATQLPINNAPPPPKLIIGRDQTVRDIKQRLGIEKRTISIANTGTTIAMHGWPGVGKSTLIAALTNDPDLREYYVDGILWVSLGQRPSVLAELGKWGRLLGSYDIFAAKTIRDALEQLVCLLRNKRVLLIVDDVWEVEHGKAFDVGGPHCGMLVATRLPGVAQALAHDLEGVYSVPVLSTKNSLALLNTIAPITKQYPTDAEELVNALEGLPLAINVAGRMIMAEMQFNWGITELLQELKEETQILNSCAPSDCTDMVSQTLPSVAALLRKSTDHLNPEIRGYFSKLGPFAPKPANFDLEALSAVWQIEDPKPIVRILVDRGLLEPVGNTRFQMHALLAALARSLPI